MAWYQLESFESVIVTPLSLAPAISLLCVHQCCLGRKGTSSSSASSYSSSPSSVPSSNSIYSSSSSRCSSSCCFFLLLLILLVLPPVARPPLPPLISLLPPVALLPVALPPVALPPLLPLFALPSSPPDCSSFFYSSFSSVHPQDQVEHTGTCVAGTGSTPWTSAVASTWMKLTLPAGSCWKLPPMTTLLPARPASNSSQTSLLLPTPLVCI